MDAAIFRAFQTSDFAHVFEALALAHVDFRREHADGTTALMAAAFHGDADALSRLLDRGATVTLSDVHGNNAIDLAKMRGHHEAAALLERHAAKEYVRATRAQFGFVKTGHNVCAPSQVYDFYYLEPSAAGVDSTMDAPVVTVPQPLGEVDDELLLETLLPLADGFGEDELASDEDPDSNDEVRAFFFSPWRRVRIP